MLKIKKLILFYAVTSVHMGSGSKLGVVDQPIQREIYTNFPLLPSSGIKGGFREYCEGIDDSENKIETKIIFGSDEGEGQSTPGKVIFTDAKLLFFPVKSLFGIFAWITCPLILTRFKEDLRFIGKENLVKFKIEYDKLKNNKILSISGNNLKRESTITLEDFTFNTEETSELNELLNLISEVFNENGFKEKFKKDSLIVNDDIFKYFIENSLEFLPRIRIGEGGTASGKGGNIWYEENIPPLTIFYSTLLYNDIKVNDKSLNELLEEKYLKGEGYVQLGGNQTIGRGFLKYYLLKNGG